MFCGDSYVDENIFWSVEKPDAALYTFMKLLIPITTKHAPIKKMTVETKISLD